jgi:hypothetical protein
MHRTVIPPQESPSVSYARDFYLATHLSKSNLAGEGGMVNLDGLYATRNIAVDTVIITEKDMPDCELHRSSKPNCEVVELEDGTAALVAIRDIETGDFFCVAESSDESDHSDGDGDSNEDESNGSNEGGSDDGEDEDDNN